MRSRQFGWYMGIVGVRHARSMLGTITQNTLETFTLPQFVAVNFSIGSVVVVIPALKNERREFHEYESIWRISNEG